MRALIVIIFPLFFCLPAYAGEPKVFTNEDLDRYRLSTDDSKAVLPGGYETPDEFWSRKKREEAAEQELYRKKATEVSRFCMEESRQAEVNQQQEDLKEEIQILRGNLAVQKYGDSPGVKVARDRTRKRFTREEFYYDCIKASGIPPEYFGLDRW